MRPDDDGMTLVRAELCRRVETLRALSGRRREIAENVDGLKRLALLYGLEPVARLASAFERAAEEDGGGCLSRQYLGRLAEAIDCPRGSDGASEAFLASVAVRFG
jgi:hypothetical protein